MKKIILLAVFFLFITDLAAATSGPKLPVYTLSVSFDLQKHQLNGKSEITFFDDREVRIAFGPLEIHSVSFNGKSLMHEMNGTVFSSRGKAFLK